MILPRTHAFAAAMALAVAGFVAPAALAATTSYAAILNELNGSGVSGRVGGCQELCVSGRRPGSLMTAFSPSWG